MTNRYPQLASTEGHLGLDALCMAWGAEEAIAVFQAEMNYKKYCLTGIRPGFFSPVGTGSQLQRMARDHRIGLLTKRT